LGELRGGSHLLFTGQEEGDNGYRRNEEDEG
jgi:hypothetical protein